MMVVVPTSCPMSDWLPRFTSGWLALPSYDEASCMLGLADVIRNSTLAKNT